MTRILLADDNPTNRDLALKVLEKMGCSAHAVANGRQALEALRREPFELVLMDCQMPEIDGYEATRRIRDPDSGVLDPAVPIIALTAHAAVGDRERCLDAGMNDYLSKPILLPEIAEVLRRWLNQAPRPPALPTCQRPNPLPNSPEAAVSAGGPAAPAPAGAVFDREVFLDRTLGDSDLAKTIIAGFLADIPAQVAQLKSAVAEGEAHVAGRLAHRIKGAASVVAGQGLQEAALALEQAGVAGDIGKLQANLPRLDEQFSLLARALQLETTNL